jgi:hypothetical protein
VFLLGDAASCAVRGQKVPNGYYNLERMLGAVIHHGGEIGVCGLCMDARGLTEEMRRTGCEGGLMPLTDASWTPCGGAANVSDRSGCGLLGVGAGRDRPLAGAGG